VEEMEEAFLSVGMIKEKIIILAALLVGEQNNLFPDEYTLVEGGIKDQARETIRDLIRLTGASDIMANRR